MMTALNKASKTIPVSMCGKNKYARHDFFAPDTLLECKKGEDVIADKASSECKVA